MHYTCEQISFSSPVKLPSVSYHISSYSLHQKLIRTKNMPCGIGVSRRKYLEGQRGRQYTHIVQEGHAYLLESLSRTMENIHFCL